MNLKELEIGKEYGNLTVLEKDEKINRNVICQCKCGNIKSVRFDHIKDGKIKSCSRICTAYYKNLPLIGKRYGRLVLQSISRGNDGIVGNYLCDCGNSYSNLLSAIKKLKIKSCGCRLYDRDFIKNQQTLTLNGVTHTWKEWSNITGINNETLRYRHKLGWSAEDVINTPIIPRKQKNQKPNKDLTGKKIHMLTVLSRQKNTDKNWIEYICQCECGNLTTVRGNKLGRGLVKSCGCLKQKNQTTP